MATDIGQRHRARYEQAVVTLRPEDARRLYKRAHRAHLAVLAAGSVRVQCDPSETPTTRGSVLLSQFLSHKAYYEMISRTQEVDHSVDRAISWLATPPGVSGRGDPHCVPSLCFAGAQPIDDLVQSSPKRFREHYGRPWTDPSGRTWQEGAYHTFDCLHVAGTTLPIGFHWDLQASGSSFLANGWERWEIGNGGYLNVHPDAHVRGQAARRTFPITDAPANTTSRLRTPRQRRKPRR